MSIDTIYDPAPRQGTNRILLVMLPGAKARPQDLVSHGFMRALQERGEPVDVVAAEAHLGYYLERSICEHLQHDIIAPAHARNYRRIWLMGISLGGMGALLYSREHPTDIEGVILMAPYLGARGTIAALQRAGGLACWHPGAVDPQDDESRLLQWLKAYEPDAAASPRIHLGYGTEDRFAAASELLAARLPAAHVVSMAGGHDWATWLSLWRHLLDQNLFSEPNTVARKRATVSTIPAITQC
jgi:pimeloyl-ACP methyl ester carboxylesterase